MPNQESGYTYAFIDLEQFLDEHDYDVRKTRVGTWYDQKCTYDVIRFVAEQVCGYLDGGGTQPFTKSDIWKAPESVEAVQAWFSKPDPNIEETHDEFNKFYRQPLHVLAYAGVLKSSKVGSTVTFELVDRPTLDYIASRDSNAMQFLRCYLEKTLKDSGEWKPFADFFREQTQDSYEEVKRSFQYFEISFTPKNTTVEANRIFTKVLNNLAFPRAAHGSIRGRLSANPITLADITYNRTNWRDDLSGKAKGVARREYVPDLSRDVSAERAIEDAKKAVRSFNKAHRSDKPEVLDWYAAGNDGAHVHHIFPKSLFPSIAASYENLIVLTAQQHIGEAHPNGQTQDIDESFQYTCIVSKLRRMLEFTQSEDQSVSLFYDINRLLRVLDVGLDTDYFENLLEVNESTIINGLDMFYSDHLEPKDIH